MQRRKVNQYIFVKKDNKYERETYKTIDGRQIWELVREYIHNIKVGQKFTRKELHEAVFSPEIANATMIKGMSSVDNYRALFKKCFIVESTDKLGVYKKIRSFPEDVELKRIRQYASCKNFKKWFIPFEEWF